MKKYEMLEHEAFRVFAESLQQREEQDQEEAVTIKNKLDLAIEETEKKLGYRVWDLIGQEDAIIDKYNRLMKFMKTDEYKKIQII